MNVTHQTHMFIFNNPLNLMKKIMIMLPLLIFHLFAHEDDDQSTSSPQLLSAELIRIDTPDHLMVQSFSGIPSTIRYILIHNIDLTYLQRCHLPPVLSAIVHNHIPYLLHTLKNNPTAVNYTDSQGLSPLILACLLGHQECAETLIEKGAAIDYSMPRNGYSALAFSSVRNQKNIVSLLCQKGANPNLLNARHWSVLMESAILGHTEICEILLHHHAMPHHITPDHNSALFCAVEAKSTEIINLLLSYPYAPIQLINTATKSTPLIRACRHGCLEIAQILLSHGANPNIFDVHSHSALMIAILNHQYQLFKLLLEHGAHVNSNTPYGFNPLRWVCSKGLNNWALDLLQYGANPNLYNVDNESALSNAIKVRSLLTVQNLIHYHSLIDIPDRNGKTPLMHAIKSMDFSITEYLLRHGADVNHQDRYHNTPLFIAATLHDLELVTLLIQYGADTEKPTPHNKTITELATSYFFTPANINDAILYPRIVCK